MKKRKPYNVWPAISALLLALIILIFFVINFDVDTIEPIEETELNSATGEAIYVESVNLFSGDDTLIGEATRTNGATEKKKEISTSNLYKQENSGAVAPFPTTSSLSKAKLNQFGILNGKTGANLIGYYKQEGPLSKIQSNVFSAAGQIPGKTTEDLIKGIISWQHQNLKCSTTEKQQLGFNFQKQYFPNSVKFVRNSEEIINSGCATGCTDYVISFIAIARSMGVSAAATNTVKVDYIQSIIKDHKFKGNFEGHWFAEVYLPEEQIWVVVDPTAARLTGRNSKGNYVLNGKDYVFVSRGLDPLDLGYTSTNQHNEKVWNKYYISKQWKGLCQDSKSSCASPNYRTIRTKSLTTR
jgi:hypothetical protein